MNERELDQGFERYGEVRVVQKYVRLRRYGLLVMEKKVRDAD